MLRHLYRRFFPRLRDPLLDAPIAPAPDDASLEAKYLALVDRGDPFLAARYFEGTRWRNVLGLLGIAPPARVLDLGAGDGAIELALRAGGYRPISVDRGWNDRARRLGVCRVLADAAFLPFRDEAFDAIVCIETVEHLPDVRAAACEAARLLPRRGRMLVVTPPRLRFAWKGDPHFGIRFLLLFPPSIQRAMAARRGFSQPHHYVDRIYGTSRQLARALAPLRLERILSRSRAPRRLFWDAVLMVKE